MRKGFSIVEVLVVMMTLPLVMLVGDRLFRDLAIDIPRSVQVAIQNETLLKLVETLQADLTWCHTVTVIPHDQDLQIDGGAGTSIRYARVNDIFRRTAIHDADDPNQTTETDWTLPYVDLQWTLHEAAGSLSYLQMGTHIVDRTNKRHKLKNTHLFYIGLYPGLGVFHEK